VKEATEPSSDDCEGEGEETDELEAAADRAERLSISPPLSENEVMLTAGIGAFEGPSDGGSPTGGKRYLSREVCAASEVAFRAFGIFFRGSSLAGVERSLLPVAAALRVGGSGRGRIGGRIRGFGLDA
jgi:hypothetical protein